MPVRLSLSLKESKCNNQQMPAEQLEFVQRERIPRETRQQLEFVQREHVPRETRRCEVSGSKKFIVRREQHFVV